MHDYHWSGGGWGGWMIAHGALWLVLLALLVFVVLALARRSRSGDRSNDALDLLNERYARGEIDRDEYLQRKKDVLER